MLTENEKISLNDSISIMLDFNVKLLNHPQPITSRDGKDQLQSYFTPQIERPLFYPVHYFTHFSLISTFNDFDEKGINLNQRLSEKAKILIHNQYEHVKVARIHEALRQEHKQTQKVKFQLNFESNFTIMSQRRRALKMLRK
mgnify:FL=1